jgi:stage V sporulation protein R
VEHIIGRHELAGALRICRDEDDFGVIRNYLERHIAQRLRLLVDEHDRDGAARLATRGLHALHEAAAPRFACRRVATRPEQDH